MKRTFRKLIVDGVEYGWRVVHRHEPQVSGATKTVCVDELLAFRQGTTGAALQIVFTSGESGGQDYVERQGVARVANPPLLLNLNRPKTAATLIRQAVEQGWSGESAVLVDDGFAFVAGVSRSVLGQVNEDGGASSSVEGP
ncbi:MAG: hypothetical protein HC834_01685 [Rhodospirillales bacterium]|nr:hypothetical protein [Rhodospirillales bacterium]